LIRLPRRSVLAGLGGLAPSAARAQTVERHVLAFWYGWYGVDGALRHWPRRTGRGEEAITNQPLGGFYDSRRTAVLARQAEQAKAAGLTGLIASWWGEGSFEERTFLRMLDVAGSRGLMLTPYIEIGGSPDKLADALERLHARSNHVAWLRVDGRPVVFLFDRVVQDLGLDGWREVRRRLGRRLFVVGPAYTLEEAAERRPLFDAVHVYSLTFRTAKWSALRFAETARAWMRRWVVAQRPGLATATVLPAFDDRLLPDRKHPRPVTHRRSGRTYRWLWEAAINARADWILIVSFNEWHEGSEIEPSVEHGERELLTTREMSARFLSAP
jgi:hypothetical protein